MKTKEKFNNNKTGIENMKTRIKTIENKLIQWIKLAEKKYGNDLPLDYDVDLENQKINIHYDGIAYEIINDYFSDGFNLFGLGAKFDEILNNTSFNMERETHCHITFYQDN